MTDAHLDPQSVEALADAWVEADAALPHDRPVARAPLVELMSHALRAAHRRITDVLSVARDDKIARGRGPLRVRYAVTTLSAARHLCAAPWREQVRLPLQAYKSLQQHTNEVAPLSLAPRLQVSHPNTRCILWR